MTTSPLQLTNELSTTGSLFNSQKVVCTRSSASNLIVVEVTPRPLTVKNSISINQLVKEFEKEPEVARSLSASRKKMSEALYNNKPQTLTSLRLSAGLSQDQLAMKCSTSQPYIARIEAGKNDPGTEVIEKIASALDIEAALVFTAISNQRKIKE